MTAPAKQPLRVASVSFLNAKPLLFELDRVASIALTLDVPAKLIDRLADASADVALLPTIDYQSLDNLLVIPAGGIGCDGPTLTVRLFSKRPIESITELACDGDSHTSVALARIILAEAYGIHPKFIPLDHGKNNGKQHDSLLLIGDKVICEQPIGFDYQLDLGEAWKKLTGLPFVFAVWTARGGIALQDLPTQLQQAKEAGLQSVTALVRDFAIPRGWPADIARQYMTSYLKYDINEPQLQAIRHFHHLAAVHHLIQSPAKPLKIYIEPTLHQ